MPAGAWPAGWAWAVSSSQETAPTAASSRTPLRANSIAAIGGLGLISLQIMRKRQARD